MAFKTDSRRILAGGLNLTLPGDIVPEGDALTIANWRPDVNGILRARLRESVIGGLSVFYPPVKQIYVQQGRSPIGFFSDSAWIWRGAVPVKTNPGGLPAYFVTYQGYVWIMNVIVQGRISVDGGVFLPWVPFASITSPTVALGAAGAPNGTYQYFYTYVTADGIESDPSPFSVPISPVAQLVNLSNIIPSTDPSVTRKWIYRAGGAQDQSYRVVIIDNAVTTFTDNVSELTATLLGITHTFDHDPPPQSAGIVGPYYDSLVSWSGAVGGVEYPNWIWWTKPDQPWYWPGANFSTGQHAPVGEDGEAIVRITNHDQQLIIYKQRSIWRAVGDLNSASSFLVKVTGDVGLTGDRAICTAGGVDYFEADDGIYECNGLGVKKISPTLDPLFRGDLFLFERGTLPTVPVNRNPIVRANNVMGHRNGRIYYSYADTDGGAPNQSLVYDIATAKWAQDTRAWSALYDEGTGLPFAGASGPLVYDVESNEDGAIPLAYITHAFDAGAPRNAKTWADLEIESDLGASQLTVNALYDFGAAWETLGTITNVNGRTAQVVPFPFDKQSNNVMIQIVGDAVSRVLIYAIHLRYRVEQRDALTFDTGPISLNPGKWGEYLEFAANVKAPGRLTWQFFTDEGGQLKQVATGQIASPGKERVGIEVPLGKVFEGRIVRLFLSSSAAFRVYEMRLLTRQLGTYLVNGAVWGERSQNLGTNRVKLVKKIEVDCEGGGFTLTASTDIPGDVLAARGTPQVHKGGPRQWVEFRLAPNTRGRYLFPQIVSAGSVKLFRVRVWYKMLGEAGAIPWTFADLPIEETGEVFSWVPLEVDQ